MLFLSFKPGHDGTVAAIEGGELLFSLEAEKDSFPRYDVLGPAAFLDMGDMLDRTPDVISLGGWPKGFHSAERLQQGQGYFGVGPRSSRTYSRRFFGKDIQFFESTHERSHIWCAYGMSPFPAGQPVYCLVYEGNIGRFYRIDSNYCVSEFPTVLIDPGNKYAFIYNLADPKCPDGKGVFRFDHAGKVMALAAFAASGECNAAEREVVEWVLNHRAIVLEGDKSDLKHTDYYNCGVEATHFKALARRVSDEIFRRFHNFAKEHLRERLPLLVVGGCGLNCDWNRQWADCGLFEDIFVPPVTNDSGSAIGSAVDAMRELQLEPKIRWDAYAGLQIREQVKPQHASVPYSSRVVAEDLLKGSVVAVMRGRCEIGPRALGNRSLLASPLNQSMHKRLNDIKKRESFRPIAPVVTEEACGALFDLPFASPHMLFFAKVLDKRLPAVTHVDGSARPQTVNQLQNPWLHDLLTAFGELSGVPVLCNTSLNFSGRGFINSEGDLVRYCQDNGIDAAIVEDRYLRF